MNAKIIGPTLLFYDPFTDPFTINRIDPLGLKTADTIISFVRLIPPVGSCIDKMQKAEGDAENWLSGNNTKYNCGCNKDTGKENHLRDVDGYGVAHCLTGYFAKQRGASRNCMRIANLGHEGKEFIELGEWKSDKMGLWGWAADTGSDVGYTFGGYDFANSPESCIPSKCKKN